MTLLRSGSGVVFRARSSVALVVAWLAVVVPVFGETVNQIAAVVNDEVITEADISSYLDALQQDSDAPSTVQLRSPEMRQRVLQRLIDQHLILQEAKRADITVDGDEVLQRYLAFRDRFGSDDLYRQSLKESGLSEEELKRKIKEQLLVQRVIDEKVRSTIVVSPQDVAKEIDHHPELAKPGDRVRLSHLLIRVNDQRSEAQARTLIEDIRQRLERGEAFATLAKKLSEDQHREEGGAMGWVAPDELMPELDEAIATLTPGTISSPIQTRLGFHLIRVEERRAAASLSVMEANAAVYQQLFQRKFQEAFARWLNELKRKAYIELPTVSATAKSTAHAGS